MSNMLKRHHPLSARDLERTKIEQIFSRAREYRDKLALALQIDSFAGKIMATLFSKPSTGTRLSFEPAMTRLSGSFIGFAQAAVSRAGSIWREILNISLQIHLITYLLRICTLCKKMTKVQLFLKISSPVLPNMYMPFYCCVELTSSQKVCYARFSKCFMV